MFTLSIIISNCLFLHAYLLIMKSFGLFIVMIYCCVSCNKKLNTAQNFPDCIRLKIDSVVNNPQSGRPMEVWLWKAGGQEYYYITDCCGGYNYLYDTLCNVYCAPDGGPSDAGTGNCFPGIPKNKIKKTLLWKDPR